MKTLCIIPARGGSKGLPKKNIIELNGKPLISHTIDFLNTIDIIEKDIVVSTDCDEISTIASLYGAEIVNRPPELSGDKSVVLDAVKYTLKVLAEQGRCYDLVFLLEPTSPIRKPEIFIKAYSVLHEFDSVATYTENQVPPNRLWRIENNQVRPFNENFDPFLPRQSFEKGYFLNGVLYGTKAKLLNSMNCQTVIPGLVHPIVIPYGDYVDIDTIEDLRYAEYLMLNKGNNE